MEEQREESWGSWDPRNLATWRPGNLEEQTHQRRGLEGITRKSDTKNCRFLLAQPWTCTDYTGAEEGRRKGGSSREMLSGWTISPDSDGEMQGDKE